MRHSSGLALRDNRALVATLHYKRDLPHERTKVFDVVADIERYPLFIPGCHRARILSRDGSRWLVEQEVGLRGWRWRFRTQALIERPESIVIESAERPFRSLQQVWKFEAASTAACRLTLDVDYSLRGGPAARLLEVMFNEAFRQAVTAFERRVRELCA